MASKQRFPGLAKVAAHLVCLLIVLAAWPAGAQTVTYVHTDALGSVVAKTDANGNVVQRYDYEPYGAPIGTGVTDGPAYTGHVSDSATGLSYMQQRYMDPELGVFLSVDPVTAYQKPVEQFNRYRYANGNPYKFKDPDGRQSLPRSVYETDWTKPETRQAFRDAASMVADFIPVVGDVKGGVTAVQDPSAVNIAAAVVGLIPVVGDGAGAMARGVASEARVLGAIGEVKNTEKVLTSHGPTIPDYTNSRQVGEIKDTKRVSDTSQLRAQREHAQATGREHVIVTGANTKVSSTVERQSTVVRRDDLGPKP
ncbi:RHS repeat-associated core domain-containing protein [Stenotrophomonas sp. AB1(2024)]|uniref:RHS repeat-associated core domain-containing protein n=1 Tax=Stenotrophomonas sp. AB1(2024) TaxID=3132215 RepID=UPI00309BB2C5